MLNLLLIERDISFAKFLILKDHMLTVAMLPCTWIGKRGSTLLSPDAVTLTGGLIGPPD